MTEKLEIYKCKICGNIVQVLQNGAGELVCCGENMEHLIPQTEEGELGEKHVPKIDVGWDGCDHGACTERTFVTLNHHPMTKEHYIQFIEAFDEHKKEVRIRFFEPEEKAVFEITGLSGEVKAVEYCNIHNLWGTKK